MIDQKNILDFIKKNPNTTFNNLARKLKIPANSNKILTKALLSLMDQNLISNNKKDSTYIALKKIKTIKGEFHIVGEGRFGFVDTGDILNNEKESYFVIGNDFNTAMNGDIVYANVYEPITTNNDAKKIAKITEIIERRCTNIVGVLDYSTGYVTFKPTEAAHKNINFKIRNMLPEARVLDVVVAKIIDYSNKFKEIDIIKKITNINDPMAYVKSLEVTRNVPEDFPTEVYDYVNKNIPDSIKNEDLSNRLDLRNELIVTIDGSSTKDFDDAINVKKIDENTYELGVHIADVAYYVKENTPLDEEALKRGTSIYLLDKVVPMLPFKLSNGICSLNPNEDRLTISAICKIDLNGNNISINVVPSVIRSKHRLTYERVNDFINKNKKFDNKELDEMLKNSYELSTILRNYKNKQGYIDFEIDEPDIELDKDGRVVDIKVKPSGESEKMIEDFMVRANEAVATWITQNKLPMMYRVHESPGDEKLDYFLNVLDLVGIKINLDRRKISPVSFQKVIKQINEQRNDTFLKMLFLRTMQKAVYSPNNIGHFGLASDCYCHFTSPIRRYPDVIVHRILWEFLFKPKNNKNIEDFASKLDKIASMNSTSEQNAVQLERDVNDLKFAEYYKNKLHSEFDAQVFSITKFGMFVQFSNLTDALIHASNIGNGDFVSNEHGTILYSKENPKKNFKLGQKVRVVIINADETTGKVDCVLVDDYYNYLNKKANNNKNLK
ncbi:ribonuclease R [Mycoplasma tauri]|uniref:ribonuclease R n=1 Tax=Mycoplasma tauri TaxID=547987 RepID=UPI001CBDDB8D|nr:ribonuclease R [Mycoplasma tauri]MBZ4218203.1 ribonuclease R [Mycoplasma tauri]